MLALRPGHHPLAVVAATRLRIRAQIQQQQLQQSLARQPRAETATETTMEAHLRAQEIRDTSLLPAGIDLSIALRMALRRSM